jgi:1,4-dihydroxy-2-naphthoate octaprenyltransferase
MSTPIAVWITAARPKTLMVSVAPVLIGSAMAFADGGSDMLSALGCLLMAVLIQIGTNFANDYLDFLKGSDREDRLGPLRVTAAGLVSPKTMRNATIAVFSAAVVIGALLALRGGTPMIVIAVISVVCGYLYTGGPYPLGYNGLGDLFVWIFFGPVAVGGTYYVQALDLSIPVLLAGFAPGLFGVVPIAVNNLRDADTDVISGKRTLAVRFGKEFARKEIIASIFLGALVPVILVAGFGYTPLVLISLLCIPVSWPIIAMVQNRTEGAALNAAFPVVGKMLLVYSIFFSLALLWN